MNIHLMLDSTYADDFITFTCRNFEKSQNYFYIQKIPNRQCVDKNKNIELISYIRKRNFLHLVNSIGKNDHLIIHGLFDDFLVLILFLYKKKLKNCCSIVMWGQDLYKHRNISKKSLKGNFIESIRKYVYQNVAQLSFDMPTDYSLMQAWYKTNRNILITTYPQLINNNLLNKVFNTDHIGGGGNIISVLVGNSATETNRHKEVFQFLKQYIDMPIKIFCPLSYGEDLYREKVITMGKSIFGDKFIPLLDFFTTENYINFLETIDIAIFHNNRQQAMGNITLLSCLGAKIYISKQTSMWTQYVTVGHCNFFATEEILNLSFSQFIYNTKESVEQNRLYFHSILDENNLRQMWDPVLNFTKYQ